MSVSYDAAIHAVEIAAITLTTFNGFAAGLVLLLVLLDNFRQRKSWLRISYERRVPFSLSIAILSSHVVFAVREFSQLGSGIPTIGDVKSGSPSCAALNESSWWAIWFPQVALAVRAILMAGSVIFRYHLSSIWSEVMYIILVSIVSAGLWVPSHFLNASPCSAFIIIFSAESNSSLGLAGLIGAGSLLLAICLSLIIIAWDICRATPTRRRSLYMEFEPALAELVNPSNHELLLAKKGVVCYGLGIFCQYACLLPNFTMIALSRYSEAAVYVASIIIHTTGIVLLFQYLFQRRTCNGCHATISGPNQRGLTDQEQYTSVLQRTLSDISTASDDVKRKRRRPYTTYGDGGEYSQFYRRGSTSSWDSLRSSTNVEIPDRTASGRRMPLRTPGTESRPRTAEKPRSQDLRRSRSLGGSEKRIPVTLNQSDSGKAPMLSTTDGEVSRPKPALRRTRSGSIFREELDESGPGSNAVRHSSEKKSQQPSPSHLRFALSEDKSLRGPSLTEEMQQTNLRPILLPPLNDIFRPMSALGYRSGDEEVSQRPSSSRSASEKSPALTSITMTRSRSQPTLQQSALPSTSATTSNPLSSSEFTFPFQPRSQAVAYEEDYSNWKPSHPDPITEGSLSTRQMIPTQTWPLALEALVEPDPPFAAEDRHYCITPTESRLSTITEEGTVRDSVVFTPQNIPITDYFSPSAGLSASLSNPNDASGLSGGTMSRTTNRVETGDEQVTAVRRVSASSHKSVASDNTVQ